MPHEVHEQQCSRCSHKKRAACAGFTGQRNDGTAPAWQCTRACAPSSRPAVRMVQPWANSEPSSAAAARHTHPRMFASMMSWEMAPFHWFQCRHPTKKHVGAAPLGCASHWEAMHTQRGSSLPPSRSAPAWARISDLSITVCVVVLGVRMQVIRAHRWADSPAVVGRASGCVGHDHDRAEQDGVLHGRGHARSKGGFMNRGWSITQYL